VFRVVIQVFRVVIQVQLSVEQGEKEDSPLSVPCHQVKAFMTSRCFI
jgi:hypothetical protein